MFPVETINPSDLQEVASNNTSSAKKTLSFDYEKGDFVVRDGKIVILESKDAIKAKIEKLLRTEKFKFEIYQELEGAEEFGISTKQLLGRKLPHYFIQSELEREITEALNDYEEVNTIMDFKTEQIGNGLKVSFSVILNDGSNVYQEVTI